MLGPLANLGLRLRALMGEVWLRLKDTAGAAAFPARSAGAAFPFVIAGDGTADSATNIRKVQFLKYARVARMNETHTMHGRTRL